MGTYAFTGKTTQTTFAQFATRARITRQTSTNHGNRFFPINALMPPCSLVVIVAAYVQRLPGGRSVCETQTQAVCTVSLYSYVYSSCL